MSFFRKDEHIKSELVRLYVIGGHIQNIESNGFSSFRSEIEKQSFMFSELIPAFSSNKTLMVFRDFAEANSHVTRRVKAAGRKELDGGIAHSDMIPRESDTIAIPIFELFVSKQDAIRLFMEAKENEVTQTALKNLTPVCGIIKGKVVYKDQVAQNYHNAFEDEFKPFYRQELMNEPRDISKEDDFIGKYKVHSTEAAERAAHRVKPSLVLAATLTKCLGYYDNPGFFTKLFADRSHHDCIIALQRYFADEKHSTNLKPVECAKKLLSELSRDGVKPEGEYAKMLRVLVTALNVSYKHNGNTLDWLKEVDDAIEKTSINPDAIKNLVFSYIDPGYLAWKDSLPKVDDAVDTHSLKP